MGSNMAEAHPVGFQWVMEAKARGARVIHVDPRFTRTSALADQHVTVRAGTDIAFLERFHYMLRVVKPSSPMSVGTWILTAYGAGSGLAAAAELLPLRCPLACRGGCCTRPGARRGCPPPSSRRASPRTPRRCWPRRPCRPGTRPAGNCRSCLPGRRRPAVAVSACFSRRSPRRVPRAGWPRPGRRRRSPSAPPCTSAAISTLSRSSSRRSGSSVPSPRCSSPPGGSAGGPAQ